jgi:cell division septum initiation protein DivIVA
MFWRRTMQKDFRTSLFGYSKRQINEFIARLNYDHENALAVRNERFIEMRDQNNIMKAELANYRSHEQEITQVLVKARAVAAEMVQEGERSAADEKARLMDEVRQLDRLVQALYARLETAIEQAQDTVRGFEQDLNELLMKKEVFMRATYDFGKTRGEGEGWKLSV